MSRALLLSSTNPLHFSQPQSARVTLLTVTHLDGPHARLLQTELRVVLLKIETAIAPCMGQSLQ